MIDLVSYTAYLNKTNLRFVNQQDSGHLKRSIGFRSTTRVIEGVTFYWLEHRGDDCFVDKFIVFIHGGKSRRNWRRISRHCGRVGTETSALQATGNYLIHLLKWARPTYIYPLSRIFFPPGKTELPLRTAQDRFTFCFVAYCGHGSCELCFNFSYKSDERQPVSDMSVCVSTRKQIRVDNQTAQSVV
jgi:hypothetical protein